MKCGIVMMALLLAVAASPNTLALDVPGADGTEPRNPPRCAGTLLGEVVGYVGYTNFFTAECNGLIVAWCMATVPPAALGGSGTCSRAFADPVLGPPVTCTIRLPAPAGNGASCDVQ